MGSSEALMYFDEDNIVVGICASERVMGIEFTAPLANVVREIGYRTNAASQKQHQNLLRTNRKAF